MASQMVCRCGLRFQARGVKADSKPRCPVCGSDLRVPVATQEAKRSFDWNWLKITIGVGSAIGLVALVVSINYAGRVRPHLAPTPARKIPNPPVTTTPSPSVSLPSHSIGELDRQMVPVGPIDVR